MIRSACIVAFLACLGPTFAYSDIYGSSRYFPDTPSVLYLLGDISQGDSFELRRAMRDHDIRMVVTASRGGSLYEGLQIAAILHDKGIFTYIPEAASCESSCANVFLGGRGRMVLGEIGVHQFYSGADNADDAVRGDVATAKTQYTTSEVIGILNDFDTPPFVYEKMFGTTGMHYFEEDRKRELNRQGDDSGFLDLMTEVDAFIASNPVAIQRPVPEPEPEQLARTPQAENPSPAPPDPDERFENVDFFGMDLDSEGLRNVSLSQCESYCRGNPACAAFSYVAATRWCWPKSGVENISSAIGVISGVSDYSRVNMDALKRPFREATKTDIRGYDLYPKGLKDMSLDQCRHACLATSDCVAFSWVAKKNWCFPKYGVGELSETWGIISGMRED